MAEIIEVLPDFDGFAVKYDPSKNPFFRPIMVENLRLVASVDVGKTLLKGIAEARPRVRSNFAASINIICTPQKVNYVQSGFKLNVQSNQDFSETILGMSPSTAKGHSPAGLDGRVKGCPFWIRGGSCNDSVDKTASGNGTGSVCYMRFSNVQIMTNKGESAAPYIVLAHELIHSLHCLTGVRKDEGEELWTTGIGIYSAEPMSENAFRTAFKMPLRTQYY